MLQAEPAQCRVKTEINCAEFRCSSLCNFPFLRKHLKWCQKIKAQYSDGDFQSSLNITVCQISALCPTSVVRNCWLSRTRRLPCIQTDKPKGYDHTHEHCTARTLGYDAVATSTHKRLKNRSALWCHCLEVWCQKPCKRHLEQWHGMRTAGGVKVRNNCATCIINGWNTYLTCSADLWKHTSGCSANKSRLYCPLTSAELLIVIVTQLQRRACTVDWGSPSLTSWLTAANAPPT